MVRVRPFSEVFLSLRLFIFLSFFRVVVSDFSKKGF